MTKTIEAIGATVKELGEYSAAVEVVLCDGETGEGLSTAWVMAGVRPSDEGTAKAAGTTRGLETVWAYGDSLDSWCPEPLFGQHEDVMSACYEAALAAWREANA